MVTSRPPTVRVARAPKLLLPSVISCTPRGGVRSLAYGLLDQIEDPVEMSDWHPGREGGDEAVVDEGQERGEGLDRHVPSYDAGVALAREPGLGGPGYPAQVLLPGRRERRVGAHAARHLELDAEPPRVLAAQPAHRLDQAVVVDERGDLVGVFLGQGKEERLLVREVVEDRAPRQPGLFFQQLHRGALVAVGGEGPAGTVENPAAGRLHPLRAHLRHETRL